MTSNPPSGSASNARSGTQASPCRITRRTVIVSTQQIEQFLLGTCEETLAVEIEERLFSDDAFYAQVQQVKTTLLHREAASTLPSETSAALARQLDRSPSLRQEFQRIREAETQHVFRFPVQGRPKSIFPWKIGLGFTRDVLQRAMRAFVPIAINIVVLILLCGGLAWVLVRLVGIDPLTAYLATSPGGMDSVAIIAASAKTDLPFVMALHAVRFVIVLAFGPAVARVLARDMAR